MELTEQEVGDRAVELAERLEAACEGERDDVVLCALLAMAKAIVTDPAYSPMPPQYRQIVEIANDFHEVFTGGRISSEVVPYRH